MSYVKRQLLAITFVTVIGAAACGTGLDPNHPTPPGGSIRASTAAADELEKHVRNQVFDPSRLDFRISVTSLQATSYLQLRTPGLPLDKPQIWFARGRLFARDTFTGVCLLHAEVFLVAAPKVEGTRLAITIEQLTIGWYSLPQELLPVISRSITDSIADTSVNFDIIAVEVVEDRFVLTGRKRRG